tara:strand:+ start:738 stop:1088 length:351 start_codon:yes stop_codon:yes gene_type:complete
MLGKMDFRDLDALHTAHDLLIEIHDISQSFPADNQFTLGDAICATALEIPAILAEGCGQKNDCALKKSISKAVGLTSRLEYFILVAGQLGIVDEESLADLTHLIEALKTELNKSFA